MTSTLGASIGALDIVVVALGEARAVSGLAGLLLTANGIGALVGSVLYAGRHWRISPAVRAAGALAGAALSYAVLAAVAAPGGPVAVWYLAVAGAAGFFAAARSP